LGLDVARDPLALDQRHDRERVVEEALELLLDEVLLLVGRHVDREDGPDGAPIEQPATLSIGTPASRSARNAPRCAKPRAPPPLSTRPTPCPLARRASRWTSEVEPARRCTTRSAREAPHQGRRAVGALDPGGVGDGEDPHDVVRAVQDRDQLADPAQLGVVGLGRHDEHHAVGLAERPDGPRGAVPVGLEQDVVVADVGLVHELREARDPHAAVAALGDVRPVEEVVDAGARQVHDRAVALDLGEHLGSSCGGPASVAMATVIDAARSARRFGGRRNRATTLRATWSITAGLLCTSSSNSSVRNVASVVSRMARTVAERGAASSRPSSPTTSPRPSSRTSASAPSSERITTSSRPLTTKCAASDGSPCWKSVAPGSSRRNSTRSTICCTSCGSLTPITLGGHHGDLAAVDALARSARHGVRPLRVRSSQRSNSSRATTMTTASPSAARSRCGVRP
jgi:hypothetical protein